MVTMKEHLGLLQQHYYWLDDILIAKPTS